MPRKKVATPKRQEPAVRCLDAVLGRPPARGRWVVALMAAREAHQAFERDLWDEFVDELEVTELATYLAIQRARPDAKFQQYFPGVPGERQALRWAKAMALEAGGFSPEMVIPHDLSVETPRGRPEQMTPEEFITLDSAARDSWRAEYDGREPKDVDIWVALGMPRRTYYRLKGRKG